MIEAAELDAAIDRIDRLIGEDEALALRATPKAAPAAPVVALDRKEAIRRARVLLGPRLDSRNAPAYPVEALGPLADACSAVAEHGQVRHALVGQSLLGAASLLTQGLWNVETLAGPRPLSLYLLTLGDSGDGKSTAQNAALFPVSQWQRQAAKGYTEELVQYERIKATRKKGEEPPEYPPQPYRLCRDATVEGLRRDLQDGPCAQGVFTDEAAAILSGYGMKAEERSKTAGVYSQLWDSGHLSVSRVTGGRIERYGMRVALHWLIQPMAAADAATDPLLSALGFWPRFLLAWPAPQDPRRAMAFHPQELPAVQSYEQRCQELLGTALPEDATDGPILELAHAAKDMLGYAFERFEQDARKGELRCIKPFALRAAEHACRIAGVLAAFGKRNHVSTDDMQGALALTAYSLATWKSVIDDSAADTRAPAALRLYEWLTERPQWCAGLREMLRDGPSMVRSKDKRDDALELLTEFDLVEIVAGTATAMIPTAGGES